jgi:PleD family two-component response regulator
LTSRNAATDEPFSLSLSLGLGDSAAGEDVSLDELVAAADLRMLEAKRVKKAGR